ncbi:hypothetical protein D3C83_292710 [compost metagenome]
MFCAHDQAYFASSSLRAADTPPEPGTVVSVFSLSFQWCTEATWMASFSET